MAARLMFVPGMTRYFPLHYGGRSICETRARAETARRVLFLRKHPICRFVITMINLSTTTVAVIVSSASKALTLSINEVILGCFYHQASSCVVSRTAAALVSMRTATRSRVRGSTEDCRDSLFVVVLHHSYIQVKSRQIS